MSEWKNIKLRDIIEIKHGWPFKSSLFNENGDSSLPIVVGIGNFKYSGGFRFEETKANRYEGEYPVEYKLKSDDILLIMTCQTEGGEILGIPGKIPNSTETYLHNQRLGKVIIKDYNETSPYFLYWYFISSDFNQQLFASATGTKILHTSPDRILDCSLIIPELEEQKSIANVLDSISAKIDLLHRQNKTLEQMAETLFRQWFIEEAKEDWNEGVLSDIMDVNPTYSLSKGVSAPYLEMKNVSSTTFNPEYWYDRDFTSGMKFQNGDTLLARITPCLENGKTCHVTFLKDKEIGWGSTEYIVMRMKKPFHSFISYLIAKSSDFRDYAITSMSGSSGRQRAQANVLKEYPIAIPDKETINQLNNQIEPILKKMNWNATQIRTLENLRDTLLPKLMSGEVTIADVQTQDLASPQDKQ